MAAELHQGPLSGLRVIDLATVFAGPSAARRLADFGAEVIKVERVGDGDGARTLGEQDGADGYYWRQIGRNKRPIELDLKTAGGKEVLLRLVRETLCTDLTVADSVDGITFAADGCSGTVAVQRAD